MRTWPHRSKAASNVTVFPDFYVKSISNRTLTSVSCTFCPANSTTNPKLLRTPQSFHNLMWNRARATVSSTFCRPYVESAPKASMFLTMFMWIRALARVSCTVCRPHLAQVLRTPQFLDIQLQIKLKLHSCALFVDNLFADRGPQPQKQRPYVGDHGSHFTRKNTGLRAGESFQAGIHTFPPSVSLPNYWMMIMMMMMMMMMMMWLTWWWEHCP